MNIKTLILCYERNFVHFILQFHICKHNYNGMGFSLWKTISGVHYANYSDVRIFLWERCFWISIRQVSIKSTFFYSSLSLNSECHFVNENFVYHLCKCLYMLFGGTYRSEVVELTWNIIYHQDVTMLKN